MSVVKRKRRVVMLNSENVPKKGDIIKLSHSGSLVVNHLNFHQESENVVQHLYFLSDKTPKWGDWVLHNNSIYRVTNYKGLYLTLEGLEHIDVKTDLCEKIIASTDNIFISDSGLGGAYPTLPRPSQGFINKFVSEYNKGNIIEWVNVEYLRYPDGFDLEDGTQYSESLRTNIKDNTICTWSIKNSWNQTEVFELIKKFSSYKTNSFTSEDIQWIKNNL